MNRFKPLAAAILLYWLHGSAALGATVVFFDDTQVATPVASGITWDTVSSNGYLFTYTRDKLFTGGIGPDPIGRMVRVPWPAGVEAQAVTTPPPGVTDYKARLTLRRVDGDVFDLTAFTAKLLANTAGAGANIEIMPKLQGEDGFNDPLYFNASGYYGSNFSYDTTPNYLGSTALLKGFDEYVISLYVDYALTALTLEGALTALPGDFDADGRVDGADFLVWQRGESPAGATASDLALWQANFGAAAPLAAVAAAVPEPATLFQITIAAGVFLLAQRIFGITLSR
ncbi:hypothetical protein [Lacipirellula limnantheis]|uniref:PEP-CTERM protein-sorting domain-containing protein n=1 Tax=Lacipirellula limnantheis TaxID=2528024 RepID=A0A517TXP3_9BACT|nr:hypothetical protein [Lacipirellula limnantheis]QDT73155.1 hypothetical protein I41_23440 [Lacipirellula limnantheis]